MKNILLLPLILIIFGFIKITTLLVTQTSAFNKFSFTQSPTFSTIDDLYFSIGPTGEPQYGQTVGWNVPTGTNDEARFYHIKKGDFGLTAIENTNETIMYSGYEMYDPANNPDMDLSNDWVKLETSWNFAPNSYNILVVAFSNHNTNEEEIENGTIQVSIPFSANLDLQDVKIYNQWVNSTYTQTNNNGTQSRVYTFEYDNLQHNEIRYLYLYLSLEAKGYEEKRRVSQFDISANMVGYGSDVLTNLVNPIPHDPNAMYLMNTYAQGTFTQCNQLINYPDMYQECLNQNISWFGMQDTPCENDEYTEIEEPTWDTNYHYEQKLCYITEYPYCHVNTEDLYYRVSCFNDGEGIAKDVYIKSLFENPGWEPFDPSRYELLQTTNYPLSNAGESYSYPELKFTLGDIHLPGLADPDVVRMYSECSTAINFKASTLCNINEAILVHSKIIFTDLNDNAQVPISTNQVIAVPYEPLNDWDYCSTCKGGPKNNKSQKRSSDSLIEIFNTNGYKVLTFQSKNSEELLYKHLQEKGLNSGMYFIRITSGGESKSLKYFHSGL